MLIKAKECNLFKGLKVEKRDRVEEVTHLFFVNDAMLFYGPDKIVMLNLRCVLMVLQAVSRLSTNMSKPDGQIGHREGVRRLGVCLREPNCQLSN